LQNTYIEKQTLDFHTSQLFKARQGKDENVADWIHKIQNLRSQFCEAELLKCNEGAREGILDLSDRLRNICFIQGLASDRIQTTVRSCNYQNFDEIAETALVEESAIASKQERYQAEGASAYKCSNCGKLGHSSNKCYSRSKGEARVNCIVASGSGAVSQVTCFRCGEKARITRNCRKPPRRNESEDNHGTSGNEVRRPEQPPDRLLYSVGCANKERCDYITLELDVSQGRKLHFLVDSGVHISLIKSYKLLGTAEYEPKDRVRVKSVEGSVMRPMAAQRLGYGKEGWIFPSISS